MKFLLKHPISSDWLQNALNLSCTGKSLLIKSVAPLTFADCGSLTFSTKETTPHQEIILIGLPDLVVKNGITLHTNTPRLTFIRALDLLNKEIGFVNRDHPPQIDPTVLIGKNVSIENDVEIGSGTVIYDNVVIKRNVKIGSNCIIKSNSVIGEEGFGFERDQNGIPHRMIHLGSVIIKNNVEIGSLTTVCRGALSNTLIENNVKIDDHCHIAHNVEIHANTLICAGCTIGGSTIVEEGCWLSINASIKDKLRIGKQAFIGIGSVVVKDIPNDVKVLGNPARVWSN